MQKFKGLTNNQLKIIALIAMTVDHVGVRFFPGLRILRIIGRLALPIFAYMIAEGCRHTRNRKKYFFTVAAVALICQIVYFVAMRSLYQCILVTFSLSTVLIFSLDRAMKKPNAKTATAAVGSFIAAVVICTVLPHFVKGFKVDYGLCGVLLPVLTYLGRNKREKLGLTTVGLILLALDSSVNQWFALAAVPLLALYNGKRGKANLKYLFYVYYPLHLAAIYLIDTLLKAIA